VPEIFAWNANRKNPVECEFMIMDEAKGIQLGICWKDMTMNDKIDIVREVVELEKKMLSIQFGWK